MVAIKRIFPLFIVVGVTANLFVASTAQAEKKETVVVAPFVTSSGEEYQWIGAALAESLTQRLLSDPNVNILSQKQWAASLRERDIAARDIRDEQDIHSAAKQLGADRFIVGRYQARWPELQIQARLMAAGEMVPVAVVELNGYLKDLVPFETKIAKKLLGKISKKAVKTKPKGPAKSVYAWRDLSLCQEGLVHQSLGYKASIWLPEEAVRIALTHCENALKKDPKMVDAKAFSALALYILGENEKALKWSAQASAKNRIPGWPELIDFFLRVREKGIEDASKVLEKAIRKAPGFIHAYLTLGEALFYSGDLKAASDVFERAHQRCQTQPWLLVQKAKVNARQGDHETAIKTTDQALALVPGDPVVLMEKASRYIDAKQFDNAEATLREAMDQDPRQAAAYLRLGYVYLETNQLALARPILQKALYEADRESERRVRGYAFYDLAKISGREGQPEQALLELSRAISVGFHEKERFLKDPDLQEAVQLPGFEKLFPQPASVEEGAASSD